MKESSLSGGVKQPPDKTRVHRAPALSMQVSKIKNGYVLRLLRDGCGE